MINPRSGRLALAALAAMVAVLACLPIWTAVEAARAARPLQAGLDQTGAQLGAMRALGRLHGALDAYGRDPEPTTLADLEHAERTMRGAIGRLGRERSLTSRELAADILPLLSSFQQKRNDHAELVAQHHRHEADSVYVEELQPLLSGLETAVQARLRDPLAGTQRRLRAFERRERLVSAVTAVVAPSALLLLTLCAAILRAYRRRLGERDRAELARSQRDATTDALTRLGNRRRLLADLEAALAEPASGSSRVLLLFDLDGFKTYNDTFGHPAGDSLLQRLAAKLDAAIGSSTAYRLGGDEFCVLTASGDDPDVVIPAAAEALSEHGEGFHIGSSWGSVTLHTEAVDATAAMQLADRRMYARKNGGRPSAGRQTRDVLLATLTEREPELSAHVHDVAELALHLGRRLGLGPVELDELARAAELHDIGKVAIPDSILAKPAPLSEEEWAFMRRHTVIGERILLAAPAMAGVARLVRSHHERFDGSGYPDRLAGTDIPLGARIIAVCDAFHAMTHARVYSDAVGTAAAMAELRRQAGSQFDPTVVAAFVATIDAQLPAAA